MVPSWCTPSLPPSCLPHTPPFRPPFGPPQDCDGDQLRQLVHALCPSIFGQDMVKAGLLLALCGGVRKVSAKQGGGQTRGGVKPGEGNQTRGGASIRMLLFHTVVPHLAHP